MRPTSSRRSLFEGQNAAKRLSNRRLDISEALDIAIQTAGCDRRSAWAGIIHRDIKCENIMIRPDDVT
jgi:serine/threonine protein kinase